MATSARLDELKKKFDENPRRYFAPLANEYRKLGDLTQAVALCRAHLPNQPGHISGHIVLAQALYESRELGESRANFEAALDLDPENLIALRYLGDIAREQGEPSAARLWYERVLEADPRNEEIADLLKDLEGSVFATPAATPPTPAVTVADESMVTEASTALFLVEPELTPPPVGTNSSVEAALESREATPVPAFSADDPFFGETSARVPHDVGELEAMAEPTIDDWFSAPAAAAPPDATTAAGSDPAAFDDSFFPDLAAATPVTSPSVAEPLALSFPTPVGVDVQAPTPPFVRAEEPRSPIETPAFLASVDAVDAVGSVEAAGEDRGAARSGQEEAAEAEGVAAGDEVAAGGIPPVFLSAYEEEHAVDVAPSIPSTPAEPYASYGVAEALDLHDAPTPVDTPVIPGLPLVGFPDDGESLAAQAPAAEWTTADDEALASPHAFESAGAFDDRVGATDQAAIADFSEWIADEAPLGGIAELGEGAPSHHVVEPSVEADAVPGLFPAPEFVIAAEGASAASGDETIDTGEPVLGAVAEFETDESFASLAREAASSAPPADFILEDSVFAPPEADEVPYIASRISAPQEELDAYTIGAPEMSAHEPFPLEAVDDLEAEPASSVLAGWDDVSAETSDSMETGEEAIAPIEGLIVRETPADFGAVAGAGAWSDAAEQRALNEAPTEPVDAHAGAEAFATGEGQAATASAESAAFVTETMAELYLQQGFHDEALGIYRQLLAQQPDDPALRDRVAALERGAPSAVVEHLAPRDAIDRHGQSVRSFFQHFARREPRRSAASRDEVSDASSDPYGGAPAAVERTPTFAGVATREEALTVPDVPFSSGDTPTGLSDLFAAGAVSGADDRAASALASAFEGSDASPPAGAGERELSLEHLFRDVPERSSGAVTLDEFYESASPGSAVPPTEGSGRGEERDADIEQFTAWLEGLKKK